MTEEIFKDLSLCGETTKVQFKQAFTSQREIAKEMIAFANSKGGVFQDSGSYQTDAAGVDGTALADLDRYAIDEYLMKVYSLNMESLGEKAEQMLNNIHILNNSGKPTLAGYLFFGKHPEYNCPTCMVKAVSFFGNELGGTQYRDTKEILGNMPQVYEKSMAFLKSNLHNIQEEGASFNTLGKLEIPGNVLEEVLQNALIHRDLLRPALIRIFIFDNRVEIISPGALAGGLTEEDIRNGKTYQRNPFMATFATNALHYRGIGSGIVRILAECPNMVFQNDSDGNEFKVTLFRGVLDTIQKDESTIQKEVLTIQKAEITTQKTEITTQKEDSTIQKTGSTIQKTSSTIQKDAYFSEGKVLKFFSEHPQATIDEAVDAIEDLSLGGVKFIIAKLQQKGLLKRVGGRKHGEWVVCNDENNIK